MARSGSAAATGGGGGGVGGSGSTSCAINAEQPPRGASWFEMRDNRRAGGDGISRPSTVTATATANYMERDMLRQYELSDDYDSEDDHDGDEEEAGDGFNNHIPFFTLNMQYYDRCRERREEAWAYRYASRREITENVFEENVGI